MKNKPGIRNRYILVGDLVLIAASVFFSYALRLELGSTYQFYLPSAYWMLALAILIKPAIYYYFGLYRRMWIYASTRELLVIITAVTTSSILMLLGMLGLFSIEAFAGFPRTVIGIDWLLSVIFVGGLRFSMRLLAEAATRNQSSLKGSRKHRVLIVGAGDAGALVIREQQKNPQLNMTAIGLLDDNPQKLRQQINGVPVVGTVSDLAVALDRYRVDEVILAIPSAPGRVVRLVTDVCRLKGVPFRTMPGLYELLGGKVSVNRLREVDITDLLRRQPVHIKDDLIGETLSNRTVLVTGAGGSIGRELCRQIARWGPSELIMLGHGENSIFEAVLDLQESYPNLPIRPVIADVRDLQRLQVIFNRYHPSVVFHAAAHKHVPMMEINVEEAVTNNVLGARNLVKAALAAGIDRLVMISTDKAIRPVNIMGATKRLAEMIVLNAARESGKSFSVVRFGNVLGSRGSVVPIFKNQIARGGPVKITHPDMRRYFMTIPEAVHLVLQAVGMGQGSDTFVLNMGQQVRIMDLAEDLIRLSGLEPGKDVDIVFTGIRPGEKLAEDLWEEGGTFAPTEHPDIFMLVDNPIVGGEALEQLLDRIILMAYEGRGEEITALIDETIPGAHVRGTPPPDMTAIE